MRPWRGRSPRTEQLSSSTEPFFQTPWLVSRCYEWKLSGPGVNATTLNSSLRMARTYPGECCADSAVRFHAWNIRTAQSAAVATTATRSSTASWTARSRAAIPWGRPGRRRRMRPGGATRDMLPPRVRCRHPGRNIMNTTPVRPRPGDILT